MKRFAIALAVLLMLSAAAPASAGSFGVYGSYWAGGDTDAIYGGGVRVGFNFFKWMELEFHGTYYGDSEEEIGGTTVEFSNIPVDGGLKFNFMPEKSFNIYAGAGVTYYFLSSNVGEVDDEFGYYADGGFEIGTKTKFFAEVLYRFLETEIEDAGSVEDIDFSDFAINAGLNWSR